MKPAERKVTLLPFNGCEEASPASHSTFIQCCNPVYALVDNGDRSLYWMCQGCASHNVHNRGAKIVAMVKS